MASPGLMGNKYKRILELVGVGESRPEVGGKFRLRLNLLTKGVDQAEPARLSAAPTFLRRAGQRHETSRRSSRRVAWGTRARAFPARGEVEPRDGEVSSATGAASCSIGADCFHLPRTEARPGRVTGGVKGMSSTRLDVTFGGGGLASCGTDRSQVSPACGRCL